MSDDLTNVWIPQSGCTQGSWPAGSTPVIDNVIIVGSPGIVVQQMPTSDDGLGAGTLWNNGGFVCIVSSS